MHKVASPTVRRLRKITEAFEAAVEKARGATQWQLRLGHWRCRYNIG